MVLSSVLRSDETKLLFGDGRERPSTLKTQVPQLDMVLNFVFCCFRHESLVKLKF